MVVLNSVILKQSEIIKVIMDKKANISIKFILENSSKTISQLKQSYDLFQCKS